MTEIVFFEKPGCVTNARQRALLAQSGLNPQIRDILSENWTADNLGLFFSSISNVADWFNPNAPDVQTGKVTPAEYSQEDALELLVSDPILIRRPLLKIGENYMAGFDYQEILKLTDRIGVEADDKSLEACSKKGDSKTCDTDQE